MSTYTIRRSVIGQLERGTDLYNGITRIVQEEKITLGRVTGLGAVEKSRLAYYDQRQMKYLEIEIPDPAEIVSLYGNVSIKDGKPFLHAHIVLADVNGNGRGGHLLPGGTPVFACEITIEEFEGPELVRTPDRRTGLALWPRDRVL